MSRRYVQLQQMREQQLVETTSRIYASTVAEVLFEAGVPKEDIEYVLSQVMGKAEDLLKRLYRRRYVCGISRRKNRNHFKVT